MCDEHQMPLAFGQCPECLYLAAERRAIETEPPFQVKGEADATSNR